MKLIKSHLSANHSFYLIFCLSILIASCAKDDQLEPGGDERSKYTGTWNCKETVQGQASTTFSISVSISGNSDTLLVSNFNQLGNSTQTLWLISGNSITIPSQQVTSVVLSGFGLYSNSKMTLNYSSDAETVTAECTK